MKYWMLLSLALSAPTYAGFQKSQITNFSGQYVLDRGAGHADTWQRPGEAQYNDVHFEIYKEEASLRLVHPNGEQVFEEIPEFILGVEKLVLKSIQHSTNSLIVKSSIEAIVGFNPTNHLVIEKAKLECLKDSQMSSEWRKVLDACTTDGTVSFSHMLIQETTRGQSPLASFLRAILGGINPLATNDTELDNFMLSVNRNKFKIDVKAHLDIKVNLTVDGDIEYMSHGEKNVVKIKIDKARAGFFNITDKVFSALEQRQSTRMTVQRPYVYLNF